MAYDMPSIDVENIRRKYRGPTYNIFIVIDGKKTSYSTAQTLGYAVNIAHSIASTEKLKIMNLSYQRIIPRAPPDGVYLQEIHHR